MDTQAEQLNRILETEAPIFWRLLSKRGREMFYPKSGILAQTAESRSAKINATIGEGVDDDGFPLSLSHIARTVSLPPNKIFPYAPSPGIKELRELWLKRIRESNPSLLGRPLSLPIVTSGVTHALSCTAMLFMDADDRVIIPDVRWENYDLIMETLHGGVLEPFKLFNGAGFDVAAFRNALNSGSGKLIVVLNFPNNPTGYIPSRAEMGLLASSLLTAAEQGKDILVICDDAYSGFTYDSGAYGESPLSALSSLHDRIVVVKVDGASKEVCAWGLRVGFMTFGAKDCTRAGLEALEQKAAGAVRSTISCASRLSQELVMQALMSHSYPAELQDIKDTLKNRWRALKSGFASSPSPFHTPLPCNAGYFMCLKLSPHIDSEEIRKMLLKEHGIGVVSLPGNLLRIAFSCIPERDIPALVSNINSACEAFAGKA